MNAEFRPEAFTALRLKRVPFSGIRKVFDTVRALESQGREVIHWQIGRPDFDTPAHIKQAAIEALQRGEVHYAPNLGIPSLRRAIAERTKVDTGVEVEGEKQVIVMAGANEGIMVAMLAFLNPGDEVLVAGPNWHHYKSCAALADANPIEIPTREEEGFSLRPEEVEKRISRRTRMLCITSPGNPTGCVESRASLEALADLVHRHDLLVLSDEIYSRIYYGPQPAAVPAMAGSDATASPLAGTSGMPVAPSIYSLPGMAERTVIINGFSKTYSMDGWRLGWTVAGPELTRALLKVRQYTTVCVNTFIQHGAAAALTADQRCVHEMVDAFAERRKIVLEGLRAIPGITVAEPLGAFYAFPNIRSFGMSSEAMAEYLLDEHGIATVAGSVFGDAGEGYLRIAYSCSTEECRRGVERLAEALQRT
jgi:aspartate/methionine/tyrosine aminotransferase